MQLLCCCRYVKGVVRAFGKMLQNSFENNCFSASLHPFLPPHQLLPVWVLGPSMGRAGSRAVAVWQPHSDPGNYLPCLWGSWKSLLRTQTVHKIKLELVCTEKSLVLIEFFLKIWAACRDPELLPKYMKMLPWRSRNHLAMHDGKFWRLFSQIFANTLKIKNVNYMLLVAVVILLSCSLQ